MTESLRVRGFSTGDGGGGAARAASRIHRALLGAGVDCTLHVSQRTSSDPTVIAPAAPAAKAAALLRRRLGRVPLRLSTAATDGKRSPALLPSRRVARLNQSDAHVCHLHWVADELLSVEDIGRIRKPVVWTLHDMWAFCGAEHLAWDDRYRVGYRPDNRPGNERGVDLNRWTWNRKRRAWRRPLHIVTPSRWLAECARSSILMADWPVEVIPNPIDLDLWRPIPKPVAREILGISPGARVLAFGTMGENRAHHKGIDLLEAALSRLRAQVPRLELLIFGDDGSNGGPSVGIPARHTGILHDELSMRLVYGAADALVVPSRIDNFPNTAVEAMACGTPVVAFRAGGLPDMVAHEETGYLAQPFEPDDLARGVVWAISDPERSARLGGSARRVAEQRFAAGRVADLYVSLFMRILHEAPCPPALAEAT
jgi:glycosyltransferase involved in cell wall biosynthesis